MRISCSSADGTYELLKQLLPEIVQEIAKRLGVGVKDIRLDNLNVIPRIEADNEGVIDDKYKN